MFLTAHPQPLTLLSPSSVFLQRGFTIDSKEPLLGSGSGVADGRRARRASRRELGYAGVFAGSVLQTRPRRDGIVTCTYDRFVRVRPPLLCRFAQVYNRILRCRCELDQQTLSMLPAAAARFPHPDPIFHLVRSPHVKSRRASHKVVYGLCSCDAKLTVRTTACRIAGQGC